MWHLFVSFSIIWIQKVANEKQQHQYKDKAVVVGFSALATYKTFKRLENYQSLYIYVCRVYMTRYEFAIAFLSMRNLTCYFYELFATHQNLKCSLLQLSSLVLQVRLQINTILLHILIAQ